MKGDKRKLIVEALEGKRQKRVWELIKKVVETKDFKIPKKVEKTYFEDYADYFDDKRERYILIEDYNLGEGFYYRLYSQEDYKRDGFDGMFDDYFSDTEGWEQVLLIDMEEMKAYYINKEIKYPIEKIKINN